MIQSGSAAGKIEAFLPGDDQAVRVQAVLQILHPLRLFTSPDRHPRVARFGPHAGVVAEVSYVDPHSLNLSGLIICHCM